MHWPEKPDNEEHYLGGAPKFIRTIDFIIMDTITIYSTPTCKYCNDAKDFFRANNIDYTEIDVASNPEAKQEMIELSGQMGVPVIRIGTEDVIVGFTENQELLKTLLKI